MNRIFLVLCILGNIALWAAFAFGLNIGDATQPDPAIQKSIGSHMLFGLGALIFATMLHAVCLTYFMGTGRWIEETSTAYVLDGKFYEHNQRLKYRMLPWMVVSILLVVVTGAIGAVADPGTPASLDGTLGMSGATWHFTIAIISLLTNALANFIQFAAIYQNGGVVQQVLAEVHRIRQERGLPVES